jgi:hypothetical protein
MPADPTGTACNIFDPECDSGSSHRGCHELTPPHCCAPAGRLPGRGAVVSCDRGAALGRPSVTGQ